MPPHSPERFIDLDSRVYSSEAVAKTAYRLANIGVFRIDQLVADQFRVTIEGCSDGETLECFARVKNEFLTELTDQLLRERIAVQTEARRNLILAHAFSSSSLIDS